MTLAPISPIGPGSASAADVFSAPVDLSGPSEITTAPQVSSDPDGNAVAVWLRAAVNDPTDPELCDALDLCQVQAAHFDASSNTWSGITTLSPPGENAAEVDVLTNSAGNAMAIWRRTSLGTTIVEASPFNGGPNTWDLTPETISVAGGARGPQLSVGPGGTFTAVWYRSTSATSNLIESVQYAAGTWSAPDPVSTGENAIISRVVTDGSGNVMAVWRAQLVVGGPFVVRASRNTGTWGTPETISNVANVNNADAPQVTIDNAGNATATWHQSDGVATIIRVNRYTVGSGWGTPVDLSVPGNDALNPRVESDSAGNVTALWRRKDAPFPQGDAIIQTTRYSIATGTWGPVVNLSTAGRESQSQRLAVDAAGNVTAVWRRNNGELVNSAAVSIIQSALYSPTTNTWGAARDLSAPGQAAVAPATDVDPNGNVIVVWARNNGTVPVIQASRSVKLAGFTAVPPVRIFDTRPGESPEALRVVDKVKVGGTYELTVNVAGLTGVTPAANLIGAVSLNVTVTAPDAPGFVTVFPCANKSEVSNVNFVAGQTVANAVITPIATDGRICFFSNTPTHIIADLNGYFPANTGYTAVAPKRVFDTRPGESPNALLNAIPKSQIGGTTELRVPMTSLPGGVTPASGVGAVSLNVTVSNPAASGFVTVYPCGKRELVSSVNYVSGQTVANAVIAPVSTAGEVCFFSNVGTDVIVDINGWFPTASSYAPALVPARVFDTRGGQSPNALRAVPKTKIGGATELRVKMSDLKDVTPPLGVSAVALNVTVTNPDGPGFITVYPCNTRGLVSSVNFVAGQTVANAVIAPVSAEGEVCFFSNLATDLLVDINGYFAS